MNNLFPGLGKIMQGYAGSFNSEASVYGHSQPTCPSPSTIQECVLSPASSSMALFAHHTQTAVKPNHVSTLASIIGQFSQGAIVMIHMFGGLQVGLMLAKQKFGCLLKACLVDNIGLPGADVASTQQKILAALGL
ncbi:hypothetical protein DSO57_1006919 [Entomophthora muscae]|uniref:Uncharacterized protein n=1 Tax=Entomophthora muscae TaxID=34485 RepID=A0ACC2U5V0_9FUNG|nr:hypothetical protein DSO57_1006919 [Entomophthora muscae]